MPGAGACPEPPPSRHLARDAAILRSTTTGGLLRELRGDLDAIVAMALAGDERARYRDPRAFAEDLNHFLRGAPVRARPDTAWSRACRWGDRNRQTVLLALLGFSIALPGFAWLSFADLVRERHGARPPAASDAVKSIAVLPFTDLAGERDQRFLAEGLSEELIARLSRASGLRVIARNSAFQFRGSNVDVREIASRLGVTHVLEGSMRRSGSRLRIMAELVRATDGTRLWSETYDRSMGDIVRLQDEIAGTVAEELAVALQAPDRRAGPVATPEAYDRLLRGNYHFARVTRGDTEEALGLYEEATRLDPMFARAWAQLARTLVRQAGYGWISPGAVASTSRAAARKAVEIDPGMAEAHLALAEVLRDFDWDWEGSLAEFARAQDIDPENQVARYRLADLKVLLGRGDFNEEIRALKEAIARDPLDGNSINYLGDVLREAGRFEESSQTFERLVHMDQRFAAVQGNFALTLLEMGRPAEALRAADSEIDEVWRGTVRACVLWAQGGHAESQAELDRLSTREPSLVAYNLAQAHACRGERDQAFAWLDRAFTYRISDLREIRYERLLIPLREDPRFDRLLQRMKLPPIRD
jgi:serine/threonine-protein kinase